MEILLSSWKLDDLRKKSGIFSNEWNLTKIKKTCKPRDKETAIKEKTLEVIYQSDQSEYSMIFAYCSIAPTKVIHIAICVSLIYLFCRSYPLKYILFNHIYILSSLLEVFIMLKTFLEH
jgi:hypothetical protein